jgi:hypothetical protein
VKNQTDCRFVPQSAGQYCRHICEDSGPVSRAGPRAVILIVIELLEGKSMKELRDETGECLGWVLHPEAVAQIVEQALRDDAWWVAVRGGGFFQGNTVWVDCERAAVSIPPLFRTMEDITAARRRGGEE